MYGAWFAVLSAALVQRSGAHVPLEELRMDELDAAFKRCNDALDRLNATIKGLDRVAAKAATARAEIETILRAVRHDEQI